MQKNRTKFLSAFLAFILFFSFLLSVCASSHHIEHECSGEDCPVCAIVQIANSNIHNLLFKTFNVAQVQSFPLSLISFTFVTVFFVLSTPVTKKIKLNN
ncbi:hypothetical protein [Treponema zioleckii]|uniref:hypothetical protein n=1 Tax=Treponema zioleckii TaxID=331680 RepID=UPI00168AB76E|nr:hypothetical protein [Treponema zioleckii]